MEPIGIRGLDCVRWPVIRVRVVGGGRREGPELLEESDEVKLSEESDEVGP